MKKGILTLFSLCLIGVLIIGNPGITAKAASGKNTNSKTETSNSMTVINKYITRNGHHLTFDEVKKNLPLSLNKTVTFLGIGINTSKNIKNTTNPLMTILHPMIEGPCPYGNGVHNMVSHAWGSLYVNGVWQFDGCVFQCSNCDDVFISEGDPLYDETIGHYAECPLDYPISGIWQSINVSAMSYTNKSYLSGYAFQYS